MFSKREIKFGIIITMGIFIITAIISLLINIILTTAFPLNFKIAHDNEWIGYYGSIAGSIISGIVTFLGIYITIRYEKDKDLDTKRLQVYPYIKYSLINIIDSLTSGNYEDYIDINVDLDLRKKNKGSRRRFSRCCYIDFKNIGLCPAINVKIIEFRCRSFSTHIRDNIDSIEVNSNNGYCITTFLPEYLEEEKNISYSMPIKIKVEYSDLLNNYYFQDLELLIEWRKDLESDDDYIFDGRITNLNAPVFNKNREKEIADFNKLIKKEIYTDL